jgi:hypothetical protein
MAVLFVAKSKAAARFIQTSFLSPVLIQPLLHQIPLAFSWKEKKLRRRFIALPFKNIFLKK